MHVEYLMRDVMKALTEVCVSLDVDTRDGKWTLKIKQALVKLVDHNLDEPNKSGKYAQEGRYAYTSGEVKGKAGGEWLYDLCWLDYVGKPDKTKLLGMPLALESEWGNEGDISDDFQKLMLARADLRVMIFGGKNKKPSDEVVMNLADYVASFKSGSVDDQYLVAGWEYGSENKGVFKYFGINGQGKVLNFQESKARYTFPPIP